MNQASSSFCGSRTLDSQSSDSLSPQPAGPPRPPALLKPTYAKRGKITIVACVDCRRRKTKCDGKRPVCSQCHARDSRCSYTIIDEQRRLTYLRENVEQLAEEKSSLEGLLRDLSISPDEEALEILHRLRGGADMQSIKQHFYASQHSPHGKPAKKIKAAILHPSASRKRSLDLKGFSALSESSVDLLNRSQSPPEPRSLYEQSEHLIGAISTVTPQEVEEIVRRVRQHEPTATVLAAIAAGSLLSGVVRLLPGTDSDTRYGMANEYSKRGLTFGLTRVGEQSAADNEIRASRVPDAHSPLGLRDWTIPASPGFVDHLLSLYFTWQHSFFQSFPEALFRNNFASGRTKFCSRLLVSGICAAGSQLSTRHETRDNPSNPLSIGTKFFDEGLRELETTEISSIPTIAGLFVLAHVEGYRGRMSKMWDYSGRSARMAMDLNLHLRSDRTSSDHLSDEAEVEEKARVHTFWGCFISDQ
jgi:hypothetical protein